MPGSPEEDIAREGFSPRSRCIATLVWILMRTIGTTCRLRVHDPDDTIGRPPDRPMIWIFWHNRIFMLPLVFRRYANGRKGAILSSASRDGELIAAVVSKVGLAPVRGSTSRRGINALLGLRGRIRAGYDVGVVPDGPRGPRYRLGPGVVKLAQITGSKIRPLRVEYSACWTIRSWDRFRIPKPFSRIDIYFDPLVDIPAELGDEEFEEQRLRVESLLNPHHETD